MVKYFSGGLKFSHHCHMTSHLQQKTGHSIAITMGDPGGIGPEIALKAWRQLQDSHPALELSLYGDRGYLLDLAQPAERSRLDRALHDTGAYGPYPIGQVNQETGQASMAALVMATNDCLAGKARALATAPIHKTAWSLAGYPWPGHTECLASLTNPSNPPAVRMMLATPLLRVVLDSIHLPLSKAIADLSSNHLLQTLQIAHQAGPWLGLTQPPRLAVAALNPHASENGRFGDEEEKILRPAIEQAQSQGLNVSGPWPADTVFMKALGASPAQRQFDLVVCLYHDQGLIPIKLNGIDEGVNITLGLPFVRTSVDHGTACDIAGQNRASAHSLVAAILAADQLSRCVSPLADLLQPF